MTVLLRVIVLEDNTVDARLLSHALRNDGFELDWRWVQTEAEYRASLTPDLDVILADYTLPDFDAVQALRILHDYQLDIPFIVVTGSVNEEIAVACMRAGAADYLLKDRLTRLGESVRQALRARQARAERRQAEAALRASEERFRATFEQAAVGIAHLSLDGHWVLVNQKLCSILGLQAQEIYDQRLLDLVHADDSLLFQRLLHKVDARMFQDATEEIRCRRSDGTIIWTDIQVSLVRHADATPDYFVLMVNDITPRKQAEQYILKLHSEVLNAYEATIEGWGRALELHDADTRGHCQRVTEMTVAVARAMGISEEDCAHIRRGAILHDIGKLAIPAQILIKPGPLTEEEWELMRQHPRYAEEMLSPIDFLHLALDIPRYHHERWDGTGYPYGLKDEEIPLAARIFAVVDVWDALRSERPYKPAWSEEEVRSYLQEQAGKHFDPQVVTAFLELQRVEGHTATDGIACARAGQRWGEGKAGHRFSAAIDAVGTLRHWLCSHLESYRSNNIQPGPDRSMLA